MSSRSGFYKSDQAIPNKMEFFCGKIQVDLVEHFVGSNYCILYFKSEISTALTYVPVEQTVQATTDQTVGFCR